MPQVTAKARKGGVSSGSAQLLFGGVRPTVRLPSLTAGLNGPSLIAALNSSTVRVERVGVHADRAARSRIVAAS